MIFKLQHRHITFVPLLAFTLQSGQDLLTKTGKLFFFFFITKQRRSEKGKVKNKWRA